MIFDDFRCIHRGGGGFREKKCQETRMNMKPLIVPVGEIDMFDLVTH